MYLIKTIWPRKYEILSDAPCPSNTKLHRIRALRDFGPVRKGELGGYIESDRNLSHSGAAWVGENARVYGRARVSGDAYVGEYAKVKEEARIYGKSQVKGCANVRDTSRVSGAAVIEGEALLDGDIVATGSFRMDGFAELYSGKYSSGHMSAPSRADIFSLPANQFVPQ